MKKIMAITLFYFIISGTISGYAQPPDPNENGNGSNVGTTPVGGGAAAPLDGGLFYLLAFGALYAAKATFHAGI